MKPLAFLLPLIPLVLAVAGCGSIPNEVVPQGDGHLRAPTYLQASDYCGKRNKTVRNLGLAPAQGGVLFECQ